MINRIKAYKSSILGLAFIIFACVVLYKGISTDPLVLGGLFFTGLGLFFTGDAFIERLEKVVFGRVLFKKDESE